MRILTVIVLVFVGYVGLYGRHTPTFGEGSLTAQSQPVVIFDTDMGNDVDDLLALVMLLNYHRNGVIRLIGVTVSKANPYAVPYTQMINAYYGYPEIPVGYVYNGATPDTGKFLVRALKAFGHYSPDLDNTTLRREDVPEGYLLLRKLLAAQPDRSVTLIVVGFQTNLARLLDSGPDEYSPLDGVELVRRKVRLLSVMAGDFERERAEYNVRMDIAGAQRVFKDWPGDIVISGYETGLRVRYPVSSILNDFVGRPGHPIPVSYALYKKMPYENPVWDLLAVLQAIEPKMKYLRLTKRGTVYCDRDGITRFGKASSGKHRLQVPPASEEEIVRIQEALVSRVTATAPAAP